MKTKAEMLGRQLTKALEVVASEAMATTEYMVPTRTIPLDDAMVFVVKDLKTNLDYFVVTNMHLDNKSAWARIANEVDMAEINSGKWGW